MKKKKKPAPKKTDKKKKIVKKSVAKKTPLKLKPKKSVSKKLKPAVKKTKTKKIVIKKPAVKKTKPVKIVNKKPAAKKKVFKKLVVKVEPPKKISLAKRKMRYTAKELEHFKKILLEERNSILESAKANMKSLVSETGEYVGDNSTYSTHMAEQGTDEMEREKNYLFVQRDEKYLGYIQEALNRIDLGTYGVCIDCLEEPKLLCSTCPLIPKSRLEFVPITQHCLECKQLRG